MGPKKNKIKEESKKKSKEPKNAPKNQQRWKQRISSREIMIILKAHWQNWMYRLKNCDKSTSGAKRNGQIRQIVQKMVQDLIRRKNLIGTKF